ncbi:hypothetical protein WN48_01626 [Eufriesea mexicana]|nr:hypothetical protein WN48_01626 [Eufriesea mexicana]
MSLFPAYSSDKNKSSTSNESKNFTKENESTSWLYNSSYLEQISSNNFVNFSSESSDETTHETSYLYKQENLCTTSLQKEKCGVEERKKIKRIKKKKKDKKKYAYEKDVKNVYFEDKFRDKGNNTLKTLYSRVRPYYNVKKNSLEKNKKNDTIIRKESTNDSSKKEECIPSWYVKLEELQKNKTKDYNEKLIDNPNDIKLWIEYIEFQDSLGYFQQYQTAKDVYRATTLKKLSIIEKALEKNVESTTLLKLKFSFMRELLPADEFSKQLEILINKDSGNVILWQEFIMTTQTSVAMCTVPKVLDLYSKCFCILKQKARINPRVYDEQLLRMLYWCLTFLRHTGLWEQMWETIRLNLILNLSLDKDIGMEEVILMSRLPLNQLWQRTESLRENCHWISVSKNELDLVEELDWSIETSEVLLPFAYPMVGEMTGHNQRKELLNGILEGRITSGPQYLTFHPAQESYLDFIREIFFTIAENLPSLQRTSIYVWWLRFERLLIFLQKDDLLKYDNKRKKLKATLKEFFKKDDNRNNLHFYREYALIEKEMGKFDNCINILETAIQSQSACPSTIQNLEEKSALLSLYRTFIETLLDSETYKETHKARIFNVMKQIVPKTNANQLLQVEKYLENCIQNFLQEVPSEDEENTYFLPNVKCDTIVCYVYLLYLKDADITRTTSIFKSCINHYKNNHYIQEILRESQIVLLQLHYNRVQNESLLKTELNDMLNLYPNNFFALSVFASIESELPIWKSNSRMTKFQLWKAIAICLANRKRIHFLQELKDYHLKLKKNDDLAEYQQLRIVLCCGDYICSFLGNIIYVKRKEKKYITKALHYALGLEAFTLMQLRLHLNFLHKFKMLYEKKN